MVQISILSGKSAGDNHIIRRFPYSIGRAPENNLSLDEAGIWDRHLTLVFQRKEGFTMETMAEALTTVNGQPQKKARLRNGDVISLGSAKLQFWLAPVPLRGLQLREMLVWSTVAAVLVGEMVLIYVVGS
jgi:pSer/pThr/pTyr-binding forkhead associated (FHA) protein